MDEVVEASEPWQKDLMARFVENGWALEITVVEPKETVTVEADLEEVKEEPKPKAKAKKKASTKAKAKAKSE